MQVIAGRVTCLAKQAAPESALDFRPITVLGWGTYHAKRAIRALDPLLPTGLFGSRPKCFEGQVYGPNSCGPSNLHTKWVPHCLV